MKKLRPVFIGVDIGGTKMLALAVDRTGRRIGPVVRRATPHRERRRFLRALLQLIANAAPERSVRVAGIGLGLPAIVDRKNGVVVAAEHMRFLNGWRIADALRVSLRIPVRIDNDVRCFLRAESAYGAAAGIRNAVAVAIGTGIGGGILLNGRIWEGAHGSAGEFGHMWFGAGKRLAKWEDAAAKEAFARHGDRSREVGGGIASLINAFDPERVILGGGAVFGGGIRMPALRRIVRQLLANPKARRTPIVRGSLGETAQTIGAALLFTGKQN